MSADLPTASAVETVAVEEKESPTELFISYMTSLKAKLAAQKESTKEMEKELSAMEKLLKKVAKVPRAKREGTHPKGEMPTQVAAWNGFLKSTLELMKSEGWPAFELTKKGETTSYPAGVEVDGTWVWDYEEDAKRKAPNYKTAMAYASYRKANGEFVDPGAEEREAVKAAKAAEKEEAKKRKAEEREAKTKGVKKAVGGADAKAKAEAAPAKKPVAKKAAGGAGAKEPKKEELKKAAGVAAAAAAAKEEEDEDAITPWTHKGKKYLRSGRNECWAITAAGKMGKWAGVYDPESDKIDASAPEPEVEFE